MHYGVHPWLSNHGGRQLDGAPSAADTIVSIRKNCPEVFDKCEVIVDGGITRGSDIVKAIALGARAVGLGRGFLYSLVFGERGVSKAIRMLKHEIDTTMALLGVSSLDQLNPSYVSNHALVLVVHMLIFLVMTRLTHLPSTMLSRGHICRIRIVELGNLPYRCCQ